MQQKSLTSTEFWRRPSPRSRLRLLTRDTRRPSLDRRSTCHAARRTFARL